MRAVKQTNGALKLSDKDMCNWAVDNSFFSWFTGRHSAALKSVVRRGIKGWVGVTCKEHRRALTHTHAHAHTDKHIHRGVPWEWGNMEARAQPL